MNGSSERFDVVVVAASVAGCTAAILFGRAGEPRGFDYFVAGHARHLRPAPDVS